MSETVAHRMAVRWWNPLDWVALAAAKVLDPLGQRLRASWQARLPRSDTLVLNQRNVYILPTRAGWMLAVTLLVLLIASINYQLNLGYLLTFLLAGSAVVGMHVCHGNLRGMTLHLTPPDPVFAGAVAQLEVLLSHSRKTARPSVGLAVHWYDGTDAHWSHTDIPAQGSAKLQLGVSVKKRGWQPLPVLEAETRYPLGTFRVWTVWRPAAQLLVYPQPEDFPPSLPRGEPKAGASGSAASRNTGEFEGVRAYQRGDPLKLVVWKKAAKSDELVSRDTVHSQRYELWFDLAQCGALGLEGKLSRLASWVLAADKAGQEYGLRLGGVELAGGSGEAHKRKCLEALATHGGGV